MNGDEARARKRALFWDHMTALPGVSVPKDIGVLRIWCRFIDSLPAGRSTMERLANEVARRKADLGKWITLDSVRQAWKDLQAADEYRPYRTDRPIGHDHEYMVSVCRLTKAYFAAGTTAARFEACKALADYLEGKQEHELAGHWQAEAERAAATLASQEGE